MSRHYTDPFPHAIVAPRQSGFATHAIERADIDPSPNFGGVPFDASLVDTTLTFQPDLLDAGDEAGIVGIIALINNYGGPGAHIVSGSFVAAGDTSETVRTTQNMLIVGRVCALLPYSVQKNTNRLQAANALWTSAIRPSITVRSVTPDRSTGICYVPGPGDVYYKAIVAWRQGLISNAQLCAALARFDADHPCGVPTSGPQVGGVCEQPGTSVANGTADPDLGKNNHVGEYSMFVPVPG